MAGTCPCGTETRYRDCCGRLHAGEPAPTAEALMRSRYSAYVVGDAGYLLRTWHPTTRPPHVTTDRDLAWTGLEVLDVVDGGPDDLRGTVEFRAGFVDEDGPDVLHERSRFARGDDGWQYVRGRTPTT